MELAIGLGVGIPLLVGIIMYAVGVLLFKRDIGVYGNAPAYELHSLEAPPHPNAPYGGAKFTERLFIIKPNNKKRSRQSRQSRRSKRV